MFTNTTTKKKTSRWQALALVALLLVGGSVAVPQAADAASTKTKSCGFWDTRCSLTLSVSRTAHPQRVLKVSVPAGGLISARVPFVVEDDARGNILCRGNIELRKGTATCKFSYFPSRVRITITKPWAITSSIYARLS